MSKDCLGLVRLLCPFPLSDETLKKISARCANGDDPWRIAWDIFVEYFALGSKYRFESFVWVLWLDICKGLTRLNLTPLPIDIARDLFKAVYKGLIKTVAEAIIFVQERMPRPPRPRGRSLRGFCSLQISET